MKDIKGYEGVYKVSSEGFVFSVRNGRFLKSIKTSHGYMQVTLCDKPFRENRYVHRLVIETFRSNVSKILSGGTWSHV